MSILLLSLALSAAVPGAETSTGQHYCVREEVARRLDQPWERGAPRVDRPAPNRVKPLTELPRGAARKAVLCSTQPQARALPAGQDLRPLKDEPKP